MDAPTTNLQILTPSRRRVRAGDVFVMKPDDRFLFGRVIDTEAEIGPMTGVIVIYVYDVRSDTMDLPDAGALSRDDLLIPPVLINQLPWSRGYLETIRAAPLEPDDVLEQHCFWSPSRKKWFDERNHELPNPTEPVGLLGLHSFRTLDDQVSVALGLPPAPLD